MFRVWGLGFRVEGFRIQGLGFRVLGDRGLGTHRGNIRVILGLHWDNGNENGNYYNGLIGFMGFRV